MRTINVRMGFATNSSSSHSVVLLRNPSKVFDKEVRGGEFGWNFFTARSQQSKRQYMAQILATSLRPNMPGHVVELLVKEWAGIDLEKDGYVDHQSSFVIPREQRQAVPSRDFFDDLLAMIVRDDVAILGGNDNTDEVHPLIAYGGVERELAVPNTDGSFRSFTEPFMSSMVIGHDDPDWICRKDGGEWIVFNQNSGTKLRIRFDNEPPMGKAIIPELVDLKITDLCHFGCEYCYQDSSSSGKHAEREDVDAIACALSEIGVLEVAIGGGDPVLYPGFDQLIENFRRHDVVPNFSTRSMSWMRDPRLREAVKSHCGAFAISTTDFRVIPKLGALLEEYEFNRESVRIHVPMGVVDEYQFKVLVEECSRHDIGMVLLGFKRVGRGASITPLKYDYWIEATRKAGVPISADTTLMEESLAGGWKGIDSVPEQLYRTGEGKFSCYVDAVKGAIAPSSFDPSVSRLDMSKYHALGTQIKDAFGRF